VCWRVGRTGSGKTTLTRLLVHFYDPNQGAVRLGGVDLRAAWVDEVVSLRGAGISSAYQAVMPVYKPGGALSPGMRRGRCRALVAVVDDLETKAMPGWNLPAVSHTDPAGFTLA
jgi:ABC-type glutathione transport system ATPase component